MHKVMFAATYGDFMATFEYDNIKLWQELGVEVHCASDFQNKKYNLYTEKLREAGVYCHQIQFSRNPLNRNNLKAFFQLKKLLKENQIDIVDCHNPIVSIYARLAAWQLHIRRVIYTAHGFFFYKGCPLKNRLIYQPMEYIFASLTDALIVIVDEDFEAAKRMPVRGKAYYVPGIGINIDDILKKKGSLNLREELGLSEDTYLIVSVGELNKNKNHEIVLKALQIIYKNNPNLDIHYCICGQGELESYLRDKCSEMGIQDKVHLLGYRSDVFSVDMNANLFVMPSYKEGLSVSLMEAMIAGRPALVTEHGGPKDLIKDGYGGYLFSPKNYVRLSELILKMYYHRELEKRFGQYNQEMVQKCDKSEVHCIMKKIYMDILGEV